MEITNVEEQGTIDQDKMKAGTCGRCHMLVARYAPQVIASTGIYHRECYEAWYFGRYGRRPALTAGPNGNRHRFQAREPKAA